jgi:hypothetical protein
VTSAGNALVGAYLNQLGLPSSAVIFITESPPGQIRWLTVEGASKYGIDIKLVDINLGQPTNQQVGSTPSKPDTTARTAELKKFFVDYFENSGRNNSLAIQYLSRVYAPLIDYYGKPMNIDEVIRDKRAFFERWPVRQYEFNPETALINCNEMVCQVTGTASWKMFSSQRNSTSTGSESVSFTVSVVGDRPIIQGEKS